ncbi:cytochrome c [Bradyrhizobium diazoefficiens]|nr:cytochrome c [Bradyrhizobium diazoefficiens]UCF54313.1 MAG: cytochrome c [Bradyrhizobium sp.]MBR0963006.1 cytochrome c [Bradyrhizobium diazoefficiens]MBR0977166.1 cytochrome c [Bradyrhizobium diazoefficiens]MBR1005811.1 cytochrome c [Bradyrhizobium diazoefficiens]MBR1012284.1 cytochrome c [Bradyrhizobium diazoefficiens]
MTRSIRIRAGVAVPIALSGLLFVSAVHTATGASRTAERAAAEGHRLAQAWCQNCHAVEPGMSGWFDRGPSFQAIAEREGTTALSLKVFWRTSHPTMPNLVISPEQAEALSSYILSLKGD